MSKDSSHSAQEQQESEQSVRVDLWLWAVRLFKTRAKSTEACKAGQIGINGQAVKPARRVRAGDTLLVKRGSLGMTIRIRAVLNRRVGAKLVSNYLEDLTTEETYAKAAEARQRNRESSHPAREDGSGRPTKKDRRDLEEVMIEADARDSFYREMNRKLRTGSALFLAFLTLGTFRSEAEDPPSRRFTTAEGAVTFKINENLSVTAKNLAPETDEATGAFKGLSATGRVLIKFRPSPAEDWILISCGKATYDPAGDEIVLTRWPAVKARGQVMRATSDQTYVRVARTSGKWEIKGPHKLELNLKAIK